MANQQVSSSVSGSSSVQPSDLTEDVNKVVVDLAEKIADLTNEMLKVDGDQSKLEGLKVQHQEFSAMLEIIMEAFKDYIETIRNSFR